MARRISANSLESPVLKRFLIVGAVLGTGLFVVGGAAVLGIVLGTRAAVVSAAAVKPATAISGAPTGTVARGPVLIAQGTAAAAGN
jgi:hypothetical protein